MDDLDEKFDRHINSFNVTATTDNILKQIKREKKVYLYQVYRMALDKFAEDYIKDKQKPV